jgi:hypothetical protein
MADVLEVHSASALIYTSKGFLAGVVVSCSSTTAALATLYDGVNDSGSKLIEVYVASPNPVVIFFADRFAPRFVTGLYLKLAANLTATLWTHQT